MANSRPLDGIRVLGLGSAIAGPSVGHILALYGAEVIKLESHRRADSLRWTPPFKDNIAGLDRSGRFGPYNGSVLDVLLNLKHPKGLALAKRLVAQSDVLVENFSPGTMGDLGLSYEHLIEVRPNLIMVSLSMFGQTGPNCAHPGYGLELSAISGFTSLTGWPDREPVVPPGGAYTDFIVPPLTVSAILAALDRREATGQGQHADMCEYEASLWFLLPSLLDSFANDRVPQRTGNRVPCGMPHQVYRCLGRERWCTIAIYDDRQWRVLCQVIDRPELAEDPRFSTVLARMEHEAEITTAIEGWTTQRTPHEVMATLQYRGLEAGAVQNAEDLCQDPQLAHRGHFRTLEHPVMGPSFYEALPIRMSAVEPDCRPAPCFGQHTVDVCRRVLGLSDQEIEDLIADQVLY